MPTQPLKMIDLMRLVAQDEDALKVLEKSYEWQHSRWIELGKWLLATGAGTFIAVFGIYARDKSPPIFMTGIIILGSILAIAGGLLSIWRASHIAARYARIVYYAAS
jgi:hypothetical protein